ncbi:MAG: hypothetical protein R2734_10535 [Nocardioides sp.]
MLSNDAARAPAATQYISGTVGSTKVFVIDDASEYGKGIADGVADTLVARSSTVTPCSRSRPTSPRPSPR